MVEKTQVLDNIDAAFVRITNSSYVPTNVVEGTDKLLVGVTSPYLGELAYLKGIKGTYSGNITNIKAKVYGQNGQLITDVVEIPVITFGGDSGGIGYTGSFAFGVIKGTNNGKSYVVKATNINASFGLTFY